MVTTSNSLDGYYKRKLEKNKCWQGQRETGTLVHYWQECKVVQPPWKHYGGSSKKNFFKRFTTLASNFVSKRIPFPKELKARTWIDICTPMLTGAFYTTAKRQKQSRGPSTDKWMNKMWYAHTVEYCSALKRKEIWTHATTWVNLEDIVKWNKPVIKGRTLHDSTHKVPEAVELTKEKAEIFVLQKHFYSHFP